MEVVQADEWYNALIAPIIIIVGLLGWEITAFPTFWKVNKDKKVRSGVEEADACGCKLYFLGQTLLATPSSSYYSHSVFVTCCIVLICAVLYWLYSCLLLNTTTSISTSTQLLLYYPIPSYYSLANTLTSEHHNMCADIDYHPEYYYHLT